MRDPLPTGLVDLLDQTFVVESGKLGIDVAVPRVPDKAQGLIERLCEV
jgi:hypothetical protein